MTTRLPFSENEIEETIVGRWKRIVERFDQKIAVSTFSGETFTYADLDLASDQIAAHLIAELGEENLPVLLLFEHSYELIVAIMGALKANKAYVALDPNQPAKQLKLLADCAQANLLVAKPDLLQLAERVTNGRIVSFDDISHLDEPVEPIKGSADDIAGIFFTSGTISNPKGVPRSHRTIMHRVWFATDLAGFKPGDHISGLRQCGLGGGVADLFSALLNGATYCLSDIRKIGLMPLSDWLLSQKISYFHPPIVAFRQWLDMQDETTFFPELRFILPSGRKRVEDLGRLWPHVSDECVVLTSYSSTETTQMCCSIIDKSTHLTSDILDVGRPLPGKEILILDADGNGVAAGVEGEIVVRSRFISREYWRRPELSSEKFLVLDDGVTIQYRSGDFGTLQADGQLAITGRKDSQIKLRGYRVVLDEVENA
ncbi:MAG: AMP-binding protein, partial [Chloroflexota bacterium]